MNNINTTEQGELLYNLDDLRDLLAPETSPG